MLAIPVVGEGSTCAGRGVREAPRSGPGLARRARAQTARRGSRGPAPRWLPDRPHLQHRHEERAVHGHSVGPRVLHRQRRTAPPGLLRWALHPAAAPFRCAAQAGTRVSYIKGIVPCGRTNPTQPAAVVWGCLTRGRGFVVERVPAHLPVLTHRSDRPAGRPAANHGQDDMPDALSLFPSQHSVQHSGHEPRLRRARLCAPPTAVRPGPCGVLHYRHRTFFPLSQHTSGTGTAAPGAQLDVARRPRAGA
jgi:hypothetical protein